MAGDTESFVSAGVSAAQIANGINSTTRVVNTLYSGNSFIRGAKKCSADKRCYTGSTGGTLPLGCRGVTVFDTIELQTPEVFSLETNFNYSLVQQGLTAEVSCQKVSSNPIQRYINETITVTNAGGSGEVYLQTFSFNPPEVSGYVCSIALLQTLTIADALQTKRYQSHLNRHQSLVLGASRTQRTRGISSILPPSTTMLDRTRIRGTNRFPIYNVS